MKQTIVYLHGLNCSSKIWRHLLAELPPHSAHCIDYDSQARVEDSYQFILSRLPHKQFSIIGHSLGGILGYLLAARGGQVKNLVSISTPFGGSSVANLLKWFYPTFKIFRDLAPHSDVIAEVKRTQLNLPFLSLVSTSGHLPFIVGENDGVVTIDSQMSINASRRVKLQCNHFEAVNDELTSEEIRNFLFRK